MSIEALIQAHTEALLANTEAVKLLTLSLAGRSATAATKAADALEKPKAESKPAAKKETEIQGAKADIAIIDEIEPKNPDAVPYETVRALVLKMAGAGRREELSVVFKKYDISNLKVLLDKEDDFSTVNDQAKLEAVYADLQALEG